MATCFVLFKAIDTDDMEFRVETTLAVAPDKAAAEKELLRQAEFFQAKNATPHHTPGIRVEGALHLRICGFEFFVREVPLIG